MLKITARTDATETVFELEGSLAGPWVRELKQCWETAAARGGAPMVIRLCAVTFIDAEGKNLLTEMHRRGAELIAEGCMNQAIVNEIARGGRNE